MWANAQRDGRPAEYRWRPLLECRAVTLESARLGGIIIIIITGIFKVA